MRKETPREINPAHAQVEERYRKEDERERRKIRDLGYDPSLKQIKNPHEQDGCPRPRR